MLRAQPGGDPGYTRRLACVLFVFGGRHLTVGMLADQVDSSIKTGVGRWAYRDIEVHEASLVHISSGGDVLSRSHFSAGLAAYAHGLAMVDGQPIAYGALGGVPAVSRH